MELQELQYVNELDVTGDFIYDGIHTLNQMDVVNHDTILFSFLYYAGIWKEVTDIMGQDHTLSSD